METIKEKEGILLKLSNDEALVLINWLFRFNEADHSKFIQHQSENRILWDMESILEKSVNEVFSNNYIEALAKARKRIEDSEN
ncbi:MAG TPA: hypothetical protein VF677_10175 [Flavobacterium sp.]|jgi:hypothetical protein